MKKALDLLREILDGEELYPTLDLKSDSIASLADLIVKFDAKLEDGSIGVAPRPKGRKGAAATGPNRRGSQGDWVFDDNDTGNAITIWEDSWNADGTLKVPGMKPQRERASTLLLAILMYHELAHADQNVFTHSVPEAGEHFDIYKDMISLLDRLTLEEGFESEFVGIRKLWLKKAPGTALGEYRLHVELAAESLGYRSDRPNNVE